MNRVTWPTHALVRQPNQRATEALGVSLVDRLHRPLVREPDQGAIALPPRRPSPSLRRSLVPQPDQRALLVDEP